MTQQYLIGELSIRLEQLQAAASEPDWRDVARLRAEVETRPVTWLPAAMVRALSMADALCWERVNQGDATGFARLAAAAADLRRFGVCARLLPDP